MRFFILLIFHKNTAITPSKHSSILPPHSRHFYHHIIPLISMSHIPSTPHPKHQHIPTKTHALSSYHPPHRMIINKSLLKTTHFYPKNYTLKSLFSYENLTIFTHTSRQNTNKSLLNHKSAQNIPLKMSYL